MKAVSTKEIIVTLVLTEGEAKLLMGMVQNPMYDDPSQDPANKAEFRERLFNELKGSVAR